jgi:hypothetical protein
MIRKNSTFVLMACLASSLAFAGDKVKRAPSTDDTKAESEQTARSDNMPQDGSKPCLPVNGKKKKKHDAKPAPTEQEREFDRVLQGIYG